MQQLQKYKQYIPFEWWIVIVCAVCAFLALAGTALGVFVFLGGGAFPIWIRTIWAVVNIVLSVFVFVNIMVFSFMIWQSAKEKRGPEKHSLEELCSTIWTIAFFGGIGSIACTYQGQFGVQSAVLFILLCLFLFMYGSIALEMQDTSPVSIPSEEIKEGEPVCSVCKQACQYAVCLECERKHRREVQRVRSQNLRAKRAGEPATLTLAEWLEILEDFHHRCAYCQTGPYELMEHYIPIGQGKKDGGTTAKNCVPSCFKCNSQKSNRHPER